MKRVAIAGLALCMLGACSGGDSGGGTGGAGGSSATGGAGGGAGSGAGGSGGGAGPVRTIEEYCQMEADLEKPWCEYAAQCCSQADQDDLLFVMPTCNFGPPDPAECVQFINDRIADGSLQFDGAWADACIAKQTEYIPAPPASCDGLPGTAMALENHGTPGPASIPECRKLYVGLRTDGAACDYEVQCAEGLTCDKDASGGFSCTAVGTQGSPCLLPSDCADGLICNAETGVCGTLGGVGAPCLYSDDCENGLLCSGSQCAAPIPQGGSCDGKPFGCAPGTGCTFGTNTCVALKQDGEACSFAGECLGRCDETTGQCVSICGGDAY